ncbi:Cathepsin B [Trichostrongylus colubriformis]|uniref:Cathepsin B n=1 Tax=Trichostrongylus colubriformis TaxID=6319 RepID=A0AAN8F5E3_TRICO
MDGTSKWGLSPHTAGPQVGGHAVKVIGWGKEGDVPYWLIANSWHSDWGENGYFRMIRGINNCGIEEDVVAGLV